MKQYQICEITCSNKWSGYEGIKKLKNVLKKVERRQGYEFGVDENKQMIVPKKTPYWWYYKGKPCSEELCEKSEILNLNMEEEEDRKKIDKRDLEYFNLILLNIGGELQYYRIRSKDQIELYKKFDNGLRIGDTSFLDNKDKRSDEEKQIVQHYDELGFQIPNLTSVGLERSREIACIINENQNKFRWILNKYDADYDEDRSKFLRYCLQKEGIKNVSHYSIQIQGFSFNTIDEDDDMQFQFNTEAVLLQQENVKNNAFLQTVLKQSNSQQQIISKVSAKPQKDGMQVKIQDECQDQEQYHICQKQYQIKNQDTITIKKDKEHQAWCSIEQNKKIVN